MNYDYVWNLSFNYFIIDLSMILGRFVVKGKERDLKKQKEMSNSQVDKLGLIIMIRQKEKWNGLVLALNWCEYAVCGYWYKFSKSCLDINFDFKSISGDAQYKIFDWLIYLFI